MATKSPNGNGKATSNASAKAGNTASVSGGLGKGAGKRVPPATTPTVNHGGRGQRSTVGESIPVTPKLGTTRRGETALMETARSLKTHEVKVGNWTITKKWISGKQSSVTLSDMNGKVVRQEQKSTAEINAVFSFGERAARLWNERKALQDERSVAIKAGESVTHLDLKVQANAVAYDALLLKAELAGILTVLPELKPRSRKRHAATVAPTI